jgi:hypothetical protein
MVSGWGRRDVLYWFHCNLQASIASGSAIVGLPLVKFTMFFWTRKTAY